MTEYFAIHTISEDEGADDEWVTFDPRHQLGGGLWHLTKRPYVILFSRDLELILRKQLTA